MSLLSPHPVGPWTCNCMISSQSITPSWLQSRPYLDMYALIVLAEQYGLLMHCKYAKTQTDIKWHLISNVVNAKLPSYKLVFCICTAPSKVGSPASNQYPFEILYKPHGTSLQTAGLHSLTVSHKHWKQASLMWVSDGFLDTVMHPSSDSSTKTIIW